MKDEALFYLVLLKILLRDVVLRDFVSMHFTFVVAISVLYAGDHVSLKRIALFKQLVDTLGLCTFNVGQPLQITRKQAGSRFTWFRWKCRDLGTGFRSTLAGTGGCSANGLCFWCRPPHRFP